MKRDSLPFPLLTRRTALLGAGALALTASLPAARAQEATPTVANAAEVAPGVWAEVFVGTASARAAGQTAYLARFTFLPGSEIFPHGHPGTTILSVDSGVFGWTLVSGVAHVVRGALAGGTDAEELAAEGDEVLLHPGDAISYEDDVMHTAFCSGDVPAVVLASLILTEGEPLLMAMDEPM